MKTSEFQIESTGQFNTSLAIESTDEIVKLESFQACLESMILGYRLRGWLTDSEKQALDCLAPAHHICFLMKGETYLHPVDCELFTHDTIRSSQNIPGDALFQHRWEPDNDSQRGAYSIHSARINSFNSTPITLGLLGPEADAQAIHLKERFGRIIEMARSAWKESSGALDEIKSRFGSSSPYLLINRCSGRIIHASQPALDLFGCSADRIVDREFSATQSELAPLVKDHRLKMTRFTTSSYMFASVELTCATKGELDGKMSLNQSLVHKLRNKLTSIMTASGYLASGSGQPDANEVEEISQMIQTEAGLAEKVLERVQLLFSYSQLTPGDTNLTETIKQLQHGLSFEIGDSFEIRVDSQAPDLTIEAPVEALTTLFQTVVMAHVELGAKHVRVRSTQGAVGPVVVFSSDLAHTKNGSSSLWSHYSQHLAKLMDIRLVTSHEPTTGAITTLEFVVV